jgi:CMP-N,N'-diacetyllegionaminic acid synthase
MKPLIVIPARGGSKGVPGKNIKLLNGKPLIQYTIEAAQALFDKELICVSTDDENIILTVEQLGQSIPFLRPDYLATDTAGTYEVLLHAIEQYEYRGYYPDTLILLQVTSPFRTGKHIEEALKLFDSDCEMVVSVKETKSNPYYVLREENKKGWLEQSKKGSFTRRQDYPIVYELNGAIYIMPVSLLKEKPLSEFVKLRKYVMDEVCSHDIDTMIDWRLAEILASNS